MKWSAHTTIQLFAQTVCYRSLTYYSVPTTTYGSMSSMGTAAECTQVLGVVLWCATTDCYAVWPLKVVLTCVCLDRDEADRVCEVTSSFLPIRRQHH